MLGLTYEAKQFWASVLISSLTAVFGLSGLFLRDLLSLRITVAAGLAAISIILVGQFALTYSPAVKNREKELGTFFHNYLEQIEQEIEGETSSSIAVRANIMTSERVGYLGRRGEKEVSIKYVANKNDYRVPEPTLSFKKGQGCAGSAFGSGDQSFAISKDDIDGWDDDWDLTKTQNDATSHLETIICTPIYHPKDRGNPGLVEEESTDPIGILTIDSENDIRKVLRIDEDTSLDKDVLKQTAAANRLTDRANSIGVLL